MLYQHRLMILSFENCPTNTKIMERNFYEDDFEELLKEKADQYKMYPSDSVWNGIQHSLHSRRKWYWLGFALLLSGVSYYAIEALISPPSPRNTTSSKIASNTKAVSETAATEDKISSALVIPITVAKSNPAPRINRPDRQPFYGVFDIDRSYRSTGPATTVPSIEAEQPGQMVARLTPAQQQTDRAPRGSLPEATMANFVINRRANPLSTNVEPLRHAPGTAARFPIEAEPSAEDMAKINWLHEFAVHDIVVPKNKRLGWQLSFAPTINYRKLSTSKNPGRQYMVKNIPMAMNIEGDLDNLLSHKPALGFELGTHLRYKIDRTVTFKTGIQFNYARYAIEAFESSADVATIALQSTGGARRDSIRSISAINNFAGRSVKDIQNQYFQLSAPIGLEIKVLDGARLQFHVAGTIQPTYLINRNSYLITTDYRNYTREPSLVRRWNMNTSAEAFVSYSTGGISWQVGPQFRYQLLSSYSSKYPIRENLMEYGVKIGVTKTLR